MNADLVEPAPVIPAVDILMPTHNRCDVLARALRLWARQPEVRAGQVRFVIVDDGSSDGTRELLSRVRATGALPRLKLLRHEISRGPAAARNLGLANLEAPWVWITGDDVLPPRGFLRRLLEWIERHPEGRDAVLGRVTWPRALQATPFMRWMERGGSAFFFDYPGLPLGRPVTPASFYTCSVAVSRQLLETTHGFDEGFPYASHEDLELGLRLGRQGMRLWYEPDLCAFHWHPLTLASASDRVRRMGRSAWMYWGRVEDGSPDWRRLARRLLSLLSRTPGLNAWRRVLLARLSDTRPEQAKGWWLLMQLSFWIGYGEARHVLSSEKKKPRDCMSDPLC